MFHQLLKLVNNQSSLVQGSALLADLGSGPTSVALLDWVTPPRMGTAWPHGFEGWTHAQVFGGSLLSLLKPQWWPGCSPNCLWGPFPPFLKENACSHPNSSVTQCYRIQESDRLPSPFQPIALPFSSNKLCSIPIIYNLFVDWPATHMVSSFECVSLFVCFCKTRLIVVLMFKFWFLFI